MGRVLRIGFIGVPGAGKTTTARALAGCIRRYTDFKTIELVQEYARTYINRYGKIENLTDQMRIFKKQLGEEDQYPQTIDVLVTDSPVFLGFGYSIELRREGDLKDTMMLNDLYKDMNKLNQIPRYDIIFHLPPVLKPVRDGVRSELQFSDEWRREADLRLLSIFYIFPPRKLITLHSKTDEERVKEAIEHIREYTLEKSSAK